MMQTNYFPVGLRNDWVMWLAIGFFLGAAAFAFLIDQPTKADCQEDEAWVTVDHRTVGAIEDAAGVSRMCLNIEELTNG